MVLDEVAQRARVVVVARATADPDVLGGGDLHVVDVVAVPHRLKQRVGEAHRHQVLDRLLAQVMVDAKDLRLLEDLEQLGVELARRSEVVAERLLDDDPRMRVLDAVQSRRAELGGDQREELRSGRQVEDAVQGASGLLVELPQGVVQLGVDLIVVEVSLDVPGVLEQSLQHVLVGLAPREALDRRDHGVAEVLVLLIAPADADHLEALGQLALVGEVVERGQQLAVREVAGGAEDDQRRRMHRQPLESLDERVVGVGEVDRGGGAHVLGAAGGAGKASTQT